MTLRSYAKSLREVLICAAIVSTAALGPDSRLLADEADSADRDYSADLKRLPPVPADRVLETFEVEPGFKLQFAAAEPLVTDPVAMEFDEHGRLYVVEMLGYSENAGDMLGRIRLLEDADRDGVFESSTVFADGLGWPTAVICYDGGVFVGAAPEILYFKDTDGDRRADERRVVFTGFGTDNVQGLLNSFRWGLDNRIHVAVSRNGADLRRADQPNAEPLVLRGRNFAFDPKTRQFEATSGASQHGFCFDPWGNAFTCHNSDHIQQVMYDDRDMSRNPYVRPPAALKSIAVEGPAADVFRISPIEPWREIRTRLRVKGIVPGIVEGGGRAGGYFTSATGVTIYDGDAWPREFYGNAFIGDVGSNLVHRKLMERSPDSLAYVARRATNREFVASRDTWFRPVQFANGPDGNLYILDMYREVIEHPASLPPVLKKHLDLTSGRDRGRIYRVVREDSSNNLLREQLSRELPGDATDAELLEMLGHPNGWHRTTAARLVYERNLAPKAQPSAGHLDAVGRKAWSTEARPEALIQRMNCFAQLGAEHSGIQYFGFLAHPDPHVRAHAVRQAKPRPTVKGDLSPEQSAALLKLVHDPDVAVRYQLALRLGGILLDPRDQTDVVSALAEIVKQDLDDLYIRAAVLSSSFPSKDGALVERLLEDRAFCKHPAGRSFLVELVWQTAADPIGGVRDIADELVAESKRDPTLADDLMVACFGRAAPSGPLMRLGGRGAGRRTPDEIREQLAKATDGATDKLINALVESALTTAANEQASDEDRIRAVNTLFIGDFAAAQPVLIELLAPHQSQPLQSAALNALGEFGQGDFAAPVLAAYPTMSPRLRLQAVELLLSRGSSAQSLLAAIESKSFSPRDLDPSATQRLLTHADAAIREQAQKLLAAGAPKRAEVIDAYLDVLDLAGNADRGREVFKKNCAICHRKEGHGTEVGADLATVVTRTPEALLISILDPNREVDPKYLQYTVLTVDGLAKSGMIAGETATSITLKREEGVTETVPRADIESIQSTGMTLMPEGLEKAIDKQSLADLIAYLRDQ